MSRRGSGGARAADRQTSFAWSEPGAVLDAVHGQVVFEDPEVSRIVAEKAPRVPRVRTRPARSEPDSLGLPFGLRAAQGRFSCWSCAVEIRESDVVRTGPGSVICPGCGARLPFAD
jgi:hypothetical protein